MAKRRKRRGDPPATATPRRPTLVSKGFPWPLTALIVATALVGVRLVRGPTAPPRSPSPAAATHSAAAAREAPEPIAAADLVTHVRTLQVSETAMFHDACESISTMGRWVLPEFTEASARAFVTAAVGVPAQRDALLSTLQCTASGCEIFPSTEVLQSLSSASRVNVFQVLSGSSRNQQAYAPFRRALADGPFSRIEGMPGAARPWLDRIEFTIDGRRTLYDTGVLCAHVLTDSDRVAMFRALHKTTTVDAEVRTDLDPERVAQSFRPSARDAVLARFAEARRDGHAMLAVNDLLPAAMRERVNTFAAGAELTYNCFWTALRFDIPQVEGPLGTSAAMRAALQRTHRQVRDDSLYFGDVLLFANARGNAVHAANYLLGGLVLTKNGSGALQPWRVCALDEITVAYPEITEVTVWRPREESQ